MSVCRELDREITPTSQILRALDAGGSGAVELRTIVAALGTRAHGVALLLLALSDTLPLPLPSTSTVLGLRSLLSQLSGGIR